MDYRAIDLRVVTIALEVECGEIEASLSAHFDDSIMHGQTKGGVREVCFPLSWNAALSKPKLLDCMLSPHREKMRSSDGPIRQRP